MFRLADIWFTVSVPALHILTWPKEETQFTFQIIIPTPNIIHSIVISCLCDFKNKKQARLSVCPVTMSVHSIWFFKEKEKMGKAAK